MILVKFALINSIIDILLFSSYKYWIEYAFYWN